MMEAQYSLKSLKTERRRPLKDIIQALNGDSFQKRFVKFANSEKGRMRLKENRYLPALLDNHEWLGTLPDGSLGRAYLDFMTTEGLTAQGLVDEYESSGVQSDFGHPDMNIFGDRLRDTHDMLHVLTGYGRDALGEACVLGYTHGQYGGPGVAFIAYGAAFEISKVAPKGAPVFKSVNEARRIGLAATDIAYEDLTELLPRPLTEVREYLGINLPTHYHAVHALMRNKGMDPYLVISAQTAAA